MKRLFSSGMVKHMHAMRVVLGIGCAAWLFGCGAESSDPAGGSRMGTGASDDPFGNASGAGTGGGTEDFGNGSGQLPPGGAAGTGEAPVFSGPTCADAMVMAARVRPTVMMIVDGSGSMDEDFGGQSRWNALRAALMDPGGVVPTLESVIDWGLTMYDGPAEAVAGAVLNAIFPPAPGTPPPPPGACYRLIEVPAAPMNWMTIWNTYPNAPLGGSTPTQNAMQTVVEKMPDIATVQADPNLGDQVILLATDGAPNEFCGGNVDAQSEVLRHTQAAQAKGIKVFVVSLAGGDTQLQAHLEQVAAAGGTGHPPFTPMNQGELTTTLQSILGEAISCEIHLNGKVAVGSECQGRVEMSFAGAGTQTLGCGDPNGWRLKDESTIELVGSACETLKSSPMAQVNAGFPCGVFEVI